MPSVHVLLARGRQSDRATAELLPARLTAVAQPMARLHHTQMEITSKTLANHKASVRGALKRFTSENDLPSRGVPLAQEWERLRRGIAITALAPFSLH